MATIAPTRHELPRASSFDELKTIFEFAIRLNSANSMCLLVDAKGTIVNFTVIPTMPFGFKVGEQMGAGTVTMTAIDSKERITRFVSKEQSQFGFSYSASSVPVLDLQGKLLGAISITTALSAEQGELFDINNGLRQKVDRTIHSAEAISKATLENAQNTSELSRFAQDIQANVGTIADVARFIREISEQTHLLGLNAAIESSRAGESGKGFAVVSQEIRQLAASIKVNMKAMNEKLDQITRDVQHITPQIQCLKDANDSQSSIVQEIGDDMRELLDISQRLDRVMANLSQ